MRTLTKLIVPYLLAMSLSMLLPAELLIAHGGVVAEEDLCIIEIGVFSAHFTAYQPETRSNSEYCEDIPDVARAIFVLDYLHGSLKEVPVDFRIIRDVMNRTIYANWEDIQSIEDIESATVFYQPPRIFPAESLSVSYEFKEKGWYTGIVTTRHPTLDRSYQAVFGFHVGPRELGYWPLMIILILAVQAHFWVSNGGYKRWKDSRNKTRNNTGNIAV
ncbi:MAG: hypothetical protein ACI9CB_000478 [Rhodothermales bacterium]